MTTEIGWKCWSSIQLIYLISIAWTSCSCKAVIAGDIKFPVRNSFKIGWIVVFISSFTNYIFVDIVPNHLNGKICEMQSCIKNDKISMIVYYEKRLKQSALSGMIQSKWPYFLDFTDLRFLSRSSQLALVVIYHILMKRSHFYNGSRYSL